jgi:cytochrome bd-type quinol oxidase subunit 2
MVKTVNQVILIIIRKSIQPISMTTHAIMFLFVMTAYAIFCYRVMTFNYKRMWLWTFLSLIGVIWLGFLAAVSNIDGEHIAYLIVFCLGLLVIVVVGIVVQNKYYPSLLKNSKGIHIQKVFDFGFRPGADATTMKRSLNWKVGKTSFKDMSLNHSN